MNKKTIVSLLLVGMLVFSAGMASYAWFTSEMANTDNVFEAGTLNLKVNGIEASDSDSFDINLNTKNLQPGDWLTGNEKNEHQAKIVVRNNGSLPMATFGRFTLSDADGDMGKHIKIMDYKVNYYNADGSVKDRVDHFIKDGEVTEEFEDVNFALNMEDWVNNMGPQDIPKTAWDAEGLKPGEYYTITFRLQYDENATKQDVEAVLGYEVKATQVNEKAMLDLDLGNRVNKWISTDGGFKYIADMVDVAY